MLALTLDLCINSRNVRAHEIALEERAEKHREVEEEFYQRKAAQVLPQGA